MTCLIKSKIISDIIIISVICDKNRITDKECNGAPDWVASR